MKTTKFLSFYFFLEVLSLLHVQAHFNKAIGDKTLKPKIVIGIVIDQMRADYLYKFYDNFGEGGFKKLMKKGFICHQTSYNYIPTYTGPGHATIYTGTTPRNHGIIANDWYQKSIDKEIYVTQDDEEESVGTISIEGKMSPRNLLSTTITDELKLFTQLQSKVISISLKDRGAILPGGFMSDGTYWYDNFTGNWITSTFYKKSLPEWVVNFNKKNLPRQYLSKSWNMSSQLHRYDTKGISYNSSASSGLSYNYSGNNDEPDFRLLRATPMGNSFTLDFALEAIKEEKLGKGNYTDFLALSFSSTDYIGHKYGFPSLEVEDTYIKLDKEIERLLTYLESNFKKNEILIFLTSDHGAAYSLKYLEEHKITAGALESDSLDSLLNKELSKKYGNERWVLYSNNLQVYFNDSLLAVKNLKSEITSACIQFLEALPGVENAVTAKMLAAEPYKNKIRSMLQEGLYNKRSGDLIIIPYPGYIEGEVYKKGGTSHGTGFTYDTHVPLIWYGHHVNKGSTVRPVNIIDITPTLSQFLHINTPAASNGVVIQELFK